MAFAVAHPLLLVHYYVSNGDRCRFPSVLAPPMGKGGQPLHGIVPIIVQMYIGVPFFRSVLFRSTSNPTSPTRRWCTQNKVGGRTYRLAREIDLVDLSVSLAQISIKTRTDLDSCELETINFTELDCFDPRPTREARTWPGETHPRLWFAKQEQRTGDLGWDLLDWYPYRSL